MGNKDKSAEEIIEETMKELYSDIEKGKSGSKTKKEISEKDVFHIPDDFEIDYVDLDDEGESIEFDESEEEDFGEEFGDESEEEDFDEDFEEDSEEDFDEDYEEEPIRKKRKKGKGKKIAAITAGSMIGIIAVAYIGLAIYFGSHFIFNTSVNGRDVSMKSAAQAEEEMKQQVSDYVLNIEESDGDVQQIKGSDISLEYAAGTDIEELIKAQDNFLWVKALWDKPEIEAPVGVKYDENALVGQINSLPCLVAENQTASVDAHPEFQNTEFVVAPEVIGTQIDTEKFTSAVKKAIDGFQPSLKLADTDCYLLPRFVQDSQEVIAAKDAMNAYLGASITYDFNPNTEVVDASVISQWVTCDENMSVGFNTEAVKAYIATLAEKYNTRGKPRQFTTANGNTVTVEGGKFGWKIDQEAEYAALTANIQNGETVTREPAYASRGVSHGSTDIGTTYAEVDLTNQHMWFIQNGQVVMDAPVVTGNPNKGNATPQGTYTLTYKTRNATLRGERRPDGSYSYETPVAYWMPFNGGIGFHDATWQSSFGGTRYKSHGSHGCVNMPKDKAKQLYELIPDKCPVICHY